jgi:hypothetical protein
LQKPWKLSDFRLVHEYLKPVLRLRVNFGCPKGVIDRFRRIVCRLKLFKIFILRRFNGVRSRFLGT